MSSFTGINRTRKTTRAVAIVDRISRCTITVGGIATIGAVAGVCLFLLWVVLPLLGGGEVTAASATTRGKPQPILAAAEDDYRGVAWTLHDDGEIVAFAVADGVVLQREQLFDPAQVTCVVHHDDQILLGGANGSITSVRVGITADVIAVADAPPAAAALAEGARVVVDDALYERTQSDQLRRQQLRLSRAAPNALADQAILRLDAAESSSGDVVVAITADGMLHLKRANRRENFMTGEVTVTFDGSSAPLRQLVPGLTLDGAGLPAAALPDRLLLAGAGDNVYLLWHDGRLVRLDTRDLDAPQLAETLNVVASGQHITAVSFLIGKTTLLLGDDTGAVHAWFRIKPESAGTPDGSLLVRARTFANSSSPVATLNASTRSRLFAAGHADGSAHVWHGTSGRLVAATTMPTTVPGSDALQYLRLTPKEDGLFGIGPRGVRRWNLDAGHPELTLAAAFSPVWYEGYEGPAHSWQSTSGSDDFEPKFGLWVLIFGTLKATFYCLLFGVPMALLAAIYTSEFLHPRQKARIKPLIELMASLPSVVLGFLAALVFAPIVEEYLMGLLTMTLTVPLMLLLGAQLWQRVPPARRSVAERWRIPAALVAVPLGIGLGMVLGPLLEQLLFAGDIKHWLALSTRSADAGANAEGASAFGGWFFALLPLCATAAAIALTVFGERLPQGLVPQSGAGRFGVGMVSSLVLTCALGTLFTALGADLRGNLAGTFDQRNSLVVGFVMGFAVIPIIYTIAEDALSAVPEHLRAASLGAGATHWQTAVRIILPTALSGVFSAVMVGLGRAVGETMIVLMAAGNTPLLEMNVFNGFRTLSANIATELPEAVRDSTHYRTLYLAALCLFVMTFVLNTFAEIVRQRFRKRAFQL